jgi:hypothetical protein
MKYIIAFVIWMSLFAGSIKAQNIAVRVMVHRYFAGANPHPWPSNYQHLEYSIEENIIKKRLGQMVTKFTPHNICMQVVAVKYHYNEPMLVNMDISPDSPHVAQLQTYQVAGYLNINIHNDVFGSLPDGSTLDEVGYAYSIPGNVFSIKHAPIANLDVASYYNANTYIPYSGDTTALAHLVGNCFGLYNTGEYKLFGEERAIRTGPCKNCETTGDLLCETPADFFEKRNDLVNEYIHQDCTLQLVADNYSPECGAYYTTDTRNIMRSGFCMTAHCRSYFIPAQGARMRNIFTQNSAMAALIMPNNINSNFTLLSGVAYIVTRDFVIHNTGTVLSSGQLVIKSKSIQVNPGVVYAPSTNGYVVLVANPYCQ